MVSTRRIIYGVYRKLNAINSGSSQSILVIDMINAINEAYEIIVENNINLTDTNSLVRDNLRKLKIKNHVITPDLVTPEYSFFKYPENLYKRLNQVVHVTCSDCQNITKKIVPRMIDSDDLNEARRDVYMKTNFMWEHGIADEGGDGLYFYTDDPKIKVEKLVIDYYRKINYLQAPTLLECGDYQYLDYDNNLIVNDVDFDLDNTYLSRKVEDVAALLLSTDTRDGEAFNMRLQQMIQIKNIN